MSAHCTCKRDKQNEGCLNDSLRCYHVKSPAPVIMQKERILSLKYFTVESGDILG